MTKIWMTVVLAAAVCLGIQAQPTGSAEVLLEAARKKELLSGDLEGAIRQYKEILAKHARNRSVAATALVRMGQCYEKLGDAEARKAYERAVREYGDQAAVQTARARLAAMGGAGGGGETRARLLWDGAAGDLWGASADGRWVSFRDPETRDLVIRDLIGGDRRRVTNKGGPGKAGVDGSVVSRDGSRIAFHWWEREGVPDATPGRHSLRTIRADGTGERVLLEIEKNQWIQPFCWSPDGKWIAVRKGYSDIGWRILLISAEDGRERVLVTRETLRLAIPSLLAFSPDGGWLAYTAPAQAAQAGQSVYAVPVTEPASTPAEIVVGALMVGWTPDSRGILFSREQDDRRELYLLPVSSGKAAGEPRKIAAASGFRGYPLAVTANGALVYQTGTGKSWDSVVSEFDLNSIAIGKTVVSRSITGGGWSGIRGGVRFSPDGRRELTTLAQGHLLIRSLEDGSESRIVPQMRMELWSRVDWAYDGASLLVSGRGWDRKIGLYRVDVHSGSASLVAAAEEGPSTCFAMFVPSPDGKNAYCYVASGISVIDLASGKIRRSVLARTAYSVQDMRFSHDGKRLALFGTGAVEIVDVATGKFQEVARTTGDYAGGDWSPDDRFVLTILRVSDTRSELVKLPVDGGQPARTALDAHYTGLRLSPDGKRLAMTRSAGESRGQVWALENFLPAKK